MATAEGTETSERQWDIVLRWQEFTAEWWVNVLRMVAVAGIYGAQLIQFRSGQAQDSAAAEFHERATALAAGWLLVSLAVAICLQRRCLPALLKYLSVTADIALLTAAAWLAGGPNSAITRAYVLVIALAALRFDRGLIWFSMLGCLVGYEALVGLSDKVWFDAEHSVPPLDNLMMLMSLSLLGLILSRVITGGRHVADEYATRLHSGRRET